MATVGHTLVGLSLARLSHGEPSERGLRYVWPGLMVLGAHLVDIAEWVVILVAPTYFDQHFVTNSPILTAGLVVLVWAVMAVVFHVRRPWAFVLAGIAVFSHLLLDHRLVRAVLLDVYGIPAAEGPLGLWNAILAEVWLYGLLLVCVGLLQAARQRDCPRMGRAVAGVLGVAAILAAISRLAALWMPIYGLAAVHTLLLFRRALKPGLLWSLVPVVPLLALLAVELWAARLSDQGDVLMRAKDYAGASRLFQRSVSVPTRSKGTTAYRKLGSCQWRMGEFAAAEASLLHAIRIGDEPCWAKIALAKVYQDPGAKPAGLYRPREAAKLLQGVLDTPEAMNCWRSARKRLDRLRERGFAE
ncbi:MAG: tetratricopeptide repeat protein [Planctomycetota bacterium]